MEDLTNRIFNNLKVISFAGYYVKSNGYKIRQWLCKCECGNEAVVREDNLKSGNTKSCGCLQTKSRSMNGKRNKQYNKYDLSGAYGIGYTNKGQTFYFDLDDYEKIKDYYWYIDHKGYVVSASVKNKYMKLHRFILDITDSNIQVDHIGHNKFDNRKKELRIVNNGQNQMNKDMQRNSTSGYKGICYHDGRWMAYIYYNKKQIFLGYFKDINDAIKARKEAEEKYFGEYSYDNSMAMSNLVQ